MKRPDVLVEEADIHALKALSEGKASAGQQIRALRFFLNVSGVRNAPQIFEKRGELEFDTGKRFVGWQVARLVELTGVTTDPETNKKES